MSLEASSTGTSKGYVDKKVQIEADIRTAEDAYLQQQIDGAKEAIAAETQRATAEEDALKQSVAGIGADLQGEIQARVEDVAQVEAIATGVKDNLITETNERKSADNEIRREVTGIVATFDEAVDGLKVKDAEIEAAVATKADKEATYTKTEVDARLAEKAANSALNAETEARKAEDGKLSTAISTTADSTLKEAKKYADSVATGAMIWKGKRTYEQLPTSGQRVGDFYTISDRQNKEYAWNGTEWVDVGADVDFSEMQRQIAANETAIAGETTRAKAAEKANTDAIASAVYAIGNEADRATEAEGGLRSSIVAEVSRAEAAELALSDANAAEVAARIKAIEDESSARIKAIADEATARIEAVKLANEARESGDASLSAKIATNAANIAKNAATLSTYESNVNPYSLKVAVRQGNTATYSHSTGILSVGSAFGYFSNEYGNINIGNNTKEIKVKLREPVGGDPEVAERFAGTEFYRIYVNKSQEYYTQTKVTDKPPLGYYYIGYVYTNWSTTGWDEGSKFSIRSFRIADWYYRSQQIKLVIED